MAGWPTGPLSRCCCWPKGQSVSIACGSLISNYRSVEESQQPVRCTPHLVTVIWGRPGPAHAAALWLRFIYLFILSQRCFGPECGIPSWHQYSSERLGQHTDASVGKLCIQWQTGIQREPAGMTHDECTESHKRVTARDSACNTALAKCTLYTR